MRWRGILAFSIALIGLPGQAQTVEPSSDSKVPALAFKLLIRTTQPFFAPSETLKLEVACVSIPEIASVEWQERWSGTCASVKLKIEEARIGRSWGGVGLVAWLQNRLHLCILPAGESYVEENHLVYTKPEWQSITVPEQKLSGLRGMLVINAQAVLQDGEKQLDQEFAQIVTAIVSPADDAEADLRSKVQRDAATARVGDSEKTNELANELLEAPTKGALGLAVRLFDNTERTVPFWTVIENSPYQQKAIDLMLVRLWDPDLVPSYELLIELAAMKARFDKPLDFDASDRQPYTEYHPDLEDASVAYFRSLLNLLVDSGGNSRSARARAIAEIAASLAEGERCPLGTYGLSSAEAAALKSKLTGQ